MKIGKIDLKKDVDWIQLGINCIVISLLIYYVYGLQENRKLLKQCSKEILGCACDNLYYKVSNLSEWKEQWTEEEVEQEKNMETTFIKIQ